MAETFRPRIICLSNTFDQHYHDQRGEDVERNLTIPYRRDVFQSLERASSRELIVLSSPPKARDEGSGAIFVSLHGGRHS